MTARALRQATCVAVAGRGLLIEGPPSAGKSGLALALIDRGAALVGDDGVALERRGDALWALPPPNTRDLIEVPVALRLVLDPDAPRYVEVAEPGEIEGVAIPWLAFDPRIAPAAFRAELALAAHGLPPRGTLPA